MIVHGASIQRYISDDDLIPKQKNKTALRILSAHYAPYAMLSARAYWEGEKSGRWQKLLEKTQINGKNSSSLRDAFYKEWVFERRFIGGDISCKSEPCFKTKGFEAHIYRTKNCSEIVLAFRGTDGFLNWDDMKTNLRWFIPSFLRKDQVTELSQKAPALWREAVKSCPNKNPRLITTGHSLGGNLAQTAAFFVNHYDEENRYISKGKPLKVSHVYAFDPSPVTGYTQNIAISNQNTIGLRIDRIYEKDELLAYIRVPIDVFFPFRYCDPQVRGIRFQFASGGIFTQHSIEDLAANLMIRGKLPSPRTSQYLVETAVMDNKTNECNLDPTRVVPSNALH